MDCPDGSKAIGEKFRHCLSAMLGKYVWMLYMCGKFSQVRFQLSFFLPEEKKNMQLSSPPLA
jgi:hypothetical protein